MKTKLCCLLLAACLWGPRWCRSQSGFAMPSYADHVDIPFEYVNNFIIVTVQLNTSFPIKMIFDTGAEHTILSKREVGELLHIRYEREFRLVGADMKTELIAYLARHVRLDVFAQPVVAPKEDILVLKEDYFRFEEYAGVNVHGILAAKTFSNYIFKINYQKHVITLYDRDFFKKTEPGYQKVPVEIYRNKLYLNAVSGIRTDSTTAVKLLLDTGAALPLLLFSNTHALVRPPANAIPSNIGMGLGGYLEGFIGRINELDFGGFRQKGVLTYYQEVDTSRDLSYLNGRNGLVGNGILSHFIVVIDFLEGVVYLRPSRTFNRHFVFDRSGLALIAGGPALNRFTVQGIVPGSPAEAAGFLPGDRILRVGFWPATFFGLDELQRVLKKHPGKKVKLTIKRDGKKIRKTMVLRDLI